MGPDHVLLDCPQYTAGRVKSWTTSTALDTKLNGVLADLKAALLAMEETGLAWTCEKRLRKRRGHSRLYAAQIFNTSLVRYSLALVLGTFSLSL